MALVEMLQHLIQQRDTSSEEEDSDADQNTTIASDADTDQSPGLPTTSEHLDLSSLSETCIPLSQEALVALRSEKHHTSKEELVTGRARTHSTNSSDCNEGVADDEFHEVRPQMRRRRRQRQLSEPTARVTLICDPVPKTIDNDYMLRKTGADVQLIL